MSDFKSQKELEDYVKASPDNWVQYGAETPEHMVDGVMYYQSGKRTYLSKYQVYTKYFTMPEPEKEMSFDEAWDKVEKAVCCPDAIRVLRKELGK